MPRLSLYLLGPPRIESEGEPIDVDTRKATALLVYLALTRERHRRAELVNLLWPELDGQRGRAALRRTLSTLRRAVDVPSPPSASKATWLDADYQSVELRRDRPDGLFWTDWDAFRDLLAQCRTHGHPESDVCAACLPLLADAAELYRGDFLSGFTLRDSVNFDDWQFYQTDALRRAFANVLARMARGHSAQGAYEPALRAARRWLDLDRLDEAAHVELMRLYARTGQRSAALRQYGECVRLLKQELGLPPSEATTALYEETRAAPAPTEPRPLVPSRPRHNLPAQATHFIGRENELAAILARLREPGCRLLSLVGSGGSGKTRLALEAATRLCEPGLDRFEHGVFFCSLAPLQSVEAIAPAMADAVGFRFYGNQEPRQQLLEYLGPKSMLLVLDNVEHLLAERSLGQRMFVEQLPPLPQGDQSGAADLVNEVLERAPDVQILATSRARLNVEGEHVFPVKGMRVPQLKSSTRSPPAGAEQTDAGHADAGHADAVRLFLFSARRVEPSFTLTPDNQAHVVRICRLVEGLPLGILLAATWAHLLAPAEIVAQMQRSLDFLATEQRGVPERQRSLRATFDHSWHLLAAHEREVAQGLSVFRGEFTHQAARAVAGASLRTLLSLANRSLLERTPAGRYQVHELVRQYAEEQLDRAPEATQAARDRHATYYVAWLQGLVPDLRGPERVATLAKVDGEIDNVRAAWACTVERRDVARVNRALEALGTYYQQRSLTHEGESVFRLAASTLACSEYERGEPLHRAPDDRAHGDRVLVWARLLAWQGTFEDLLFRNDLAQQHLQQSLDLLERLETAGQDTRPERAFVLGKLGWHASWKLRDDEEAKRLLAQSLALYTAIEDPWEIGYALGTLGALTQHSGAFSEARELCKQSLVVLKPIGDYARIIWTLGKLSIQAVHLGDTEEAVRRVREGFALLEQAGGRDQLTRQMWSLGWASLLLGRFDEARSVGQECLAFDEERGISGHAHAVSSTALLGLAEVGLGRYAEARAHAQTGLSFARDVGFQVGEGLVLLALGRAALAEGMYPEAQRLLRECVAAHAQAGTLFNLGVALGALGLAARALGRPDRAGQHLRRALRVAADGESCWPLMDGLPGIALLLADAGQHERAIEVYALASRYPCVANSRWFADVVGRPLITLTGHLPPEVIARAQARGRARDLRATAAELLAELEEMGGALND